MLTNLLKVYLRVYKTNGILILSRFFSFTHISRKKIAVFVLEELVFDSIFLCFFPFYSIFCSSSLSPFFDMIFSGIRCFFFVILSSSRIHSCCFPSSFSFDRLSFSFFAIPFYLCTIVHHSTLL